MIDYVADWQARLLGRLAEQFRGKPHLAGLVGAVAQQAQQLEDVLLSLFTLTDIDASSGAQLDALGRLLRQPRQGADDPTFRLYLRARLAVVRSSGTPEELYAVLVAMFAGVATLQYSPGVVAEGDMVVAAPPMSPLVAAIATAFMAEAKVAGVRLVVTWQPADDADCFAFEGPGPGLGFGDDTGAGGGQLLGAAQA